MKVLHVTASDARRGAEQRALDLAEALGRLGMSNEIRSVCASGRPDSFPIESLRGGRFDLRGLLELRRLLSQVDVAIAYGSSSLPATALASIRSSTPFVYRGIGDPLYWSNTPRPANPHLGVATARRRGHRSLVGVGDRPERIFRRSSRQDHCSAKWRGHASLPSRHPGGALGGSTCAWSYRR